MEQTTTESNVLTVGQVMAAMPRISTFTPSMSALHLEWPCFKVGEGKYEFRTFGFTLKDKDSMVAFKDWTEKNGLVDQPLVRQDDVSLISLWTFTKSTDEAYVNLTLRKID